MGEVRKRLEGLREYFEGAIVSVKLVSRSFESQIMLPRFTEIAVTLFRILHVLNEVTIIVVDQNGLSWGLSYKLNKREESIHIVTSMVVVQLALFEFDSLYQGREFRVISDREKSCEIISVYPAEQVVRDQILLP